MTRLFYHRMKASDFRSSSIDQAYIGHAPPEEHAIIYHTLNVSFKVILATGLPKIMPRSAMKMRMPDRL